ncbi:MAG: MXAN_2562 family outer membrane beta-barrel protein [Labilithrix sp.]
MKPWRFALAFGFFAAHALASAAADAQSSARSPEREGSTLPSPQRWATELRIAPYIPVIGEVGPPNTWPFIRAFGDMPRLLVGLEVDWQALRIPYVGTLGVGASGAFTSYAGQVGTTETSLDVFMSYGVAVLRGDAIWRELEIPFVPYAKLGVGWARWTTSNALVTSGFSYDGAATHGYSWGSHFALGVSFAFAVLDRDAAKRVDEVTGINGAYFFGEWMRADLSGLWFQDNPLAVGTSTLVTGLTLEL